MLNCVFTSPIYFHLEINLWTWILITSMCGPFQSSYFVLYLPCFFSFLALLNWSSFKHSFSSFLSSFGCYKHHISVNLEVSLEKAMAPHSSTLAWKIPWMEKPGRLQSMGSRSWTWLSDFPFTFHFHALEKEMATHSRVLAWRVPGTGEPGGLLFMGSHRVRHDWSDLAAEVSFNILNHI